MESTSNISYSASGEGATAVGGTGRGGKGGNKSVDDFETAEAVNGTADAAVEESAEAAAAARKEKANATISFRSFPGSRASELPNQRVKVQPREKVEVNLRTLLSSGVHFGHQTSRWDPSMASNIHSTRNGIHIINLPKTMQAWLRARQAIVERVGNGSSVLFVGTKKQAQDPVVEEAMRCGAYYVSQRWLGGMLTNFQTIRKSIDRMKKLEITLNEEEQSLVNGQPAKFKKKERLVMARELEKLEFSLGGIKDMNKLPELLFVVDIRREEISIKEARRLDIPVVALVDTNCNPAHVDYAIPANDDGTRSIRLFAAAVADAVQEGKQIHAERMRVSREAERQQKKNKSQAAAANAAVSGADAGISQAAGEESSGQKLEAVS